MNDCLTFFDNTKFVHNNPKELFFLLAADRFIDKGFLLGGSHIHYLSSFLSDGFVYYSSNILEISKKNDINDYYDYE